MRGLGANQLSSIMESNNENSVLESKNGGDGLFKSTLLKNAYKGPRINETVTSSIRLSQNDPFGTSNKGNSDEDDQ